MRETRDCHTKDSKYNCAYLTYLEIHSMNIGGGNPFDIYSRPHFTKTVQLDVRNVLPAHINIVSKYAYCLGNM